MVFLLIVAGHETTYNPITNATYALTHPERQARLRDDWSLARLETKIAVQRLFERNPNLRLAVEPSQLELATRPGWHQYKAMPVVLG